MHQIYLIVTVTVYRYLYTVVTVYLVCTEVDHRPRTNASCQASQSNLRTVRRIPSNQIVLHSFQLVLWLFCASFCRLSVTRHWNARHNKNVWREKIINLEKFYRLRLLNACGRGSRAYIKQLRGQRRQFRTWIDVLMNMFWDAIAWRETYIADETTKPNPRVVDDAKQQLSAFRFQSRPAYSMQVFKCLNCHHIWLSHSTSPLGLTIKSKSI